MAEKATLETMRAEISEGVDLKHVEVKEKIVLPTPADVAAEKEHNRFLAEIADGNTLLKHSQPAEEKTVLPSPEDIKKKEDIVQAEKTLEAHLSGIEGFQKEALQATKTREPADAVTAYAAEVLPAKAAAFDKANLKHVTTTVKTAPVVVNDE